MNDDTELREWLKKKNIDLYNRLEQPRKTIQQVLARVPATFPEYTEHGWTHAYSVEKLVYELFGERLFLALSPYEIFLLIISVWCHDIGMVGTIEELPELVRREHPLRSQKYLQDYYIELGLERNEAKIIGKICRSHGEWDLSSFYETTILKTTTVQLRLLCCILSLSDACDITSDRAPEIVYKIIRPGKESDIFWKAHLDIGGLHREDDNAIWISAEYKSSRGKYMIDEVVDLLQKVLDITSPILLKYGFAIKTELVKQIVPCDAALSDISFHKFLNAQNILNILTGSLYKNKNVFVRELIQNAIDACTIKMALSKDNSNYVPEIIIHIRNNGYQFVIEDNGVGMDFYDIEKQFAVPGSRLSDSVESPSGKKIKTEGLIARFGIGILSCFLCCDKIEVETKKYSSDPLRFVINDLITKYGFVKSNKSTDGTVITATMNYGEKADFLIQAVNHYLRDIKYKTTVYLGDNKILNISKLSDMVPSSIYTSDIKLDGISGQITLNIAGSNELVVCQEGILVSENMYNLLPKYAVGIKGYLNLKSGIVDLTASRTEIEENNLFWNLQNIIEAKIKDILYSVVADVTKNGTNREKQDLLQYVIEMSYLREDTNDFLSKLIIDNFEFETLSGDYIKPKDLLEHPAIYYLVEKADFSVKRCKWLGRFILSKIDIMSNLRNMNTEKNNVIFIRTEFLRAEHIIYILKNYFAKNKILCTDITESENFTDYLDIQKSKSSNKIEDQFQDNNIVFHKIPNNKQPIIDLGSSVIMNLSNHNIEFVYNKLTHKSTNDTKRYALLSYCYMLAQRFDIAHEYVSKIIDSNKPPMINHGKFNLNEYEVTMFKAQHLFNKGLFQAAWDLIKKNDLSGAWAAKLKKMCERQLNKQCEK